MNNLPINLQTNWEKIINDIFEKNKDNTENLKTFLDNEHTKFDGVAEIFPPKELIFNAFSYFNFDCVTLNPYMGRDGILPFINNPERGAFILCRTSNNSAGDIQNIKVGNLPLYQEIAKYINNLNIHNNVGLVVGSTAQKELKIIREIAPRLPILMPGVGAQGGNLNYAIREGNSSGLGIISISRGISFTGDMSEKAIYSAAKTYVEQMRAILS